MFIVNRDLKLCPAFQKLKTLILSQCPPRVAADFNVLTYFLQCSPILEKITLQLSQVPRDQVEIEGSSEPLENHMHPAILTWLRSNAKNLMQGLKKF
ncbi:hypothetical protein ACP4OV_015017 [Aristida adscensionis]